jgi:hypothetical protein
MATRVPAGRRASAEQAWAVKCFKSHCAALLPRHAQRYFRRDYFTFADERGQVPRGGGVDALDHGFENEGGLGEVASAAVIG